MSNIVSGARRARRSAAVAAPIDYAAIDRPSSSHEDDDSANEQTSSSEDGSDVVGGKGTFFIVHLSLADRKIAAFVPRTLLRQAPFLYANSQ